MATPEYAESLYSQTLPHESPQPKRVPEPSSQPAPASDPKPRSTYKHEYIALIMMTAAVIAMCVVSLMTQAFMDRQNVALQDIHQANNAVAFQNTNLEQEVEELSSYSRIMDIAGEQGLKMNEENVRNVIK